MPTKIGTAPEVQDDLYVIRSLEAIRKSRGLSKAECARRMGISFRHFNRIVSGEYTTMENLNGYAGIFGLQLRFALERKPV